MAELVCRAYVLFNTFRNLSVMCMASRKFEAFFPFFVFYRTVTILKVDLFVWGPFFPFLFFAILLLVSVCVTVCLLIFLQYCMCYVHLPVLQRFAIYLVSHEIKVVE